MKVCYESEVALGKMNLIADVSQCKYTDSSRVIANDTALRYTFVI
jgi:hypothetical protein